MKAYLKKLSKLLSISLSFAIILTVLPVSTVHVHAATGYVDFFPADFTGATNTGTKYVNSPATVTKNGVTLKIEVNPPRSDTQMYSESGILKFASGTSNYYKVKFTPSSSSSSSYTFTGLTVSNTGTFTSTNNSNYMKATGQGPWELQANYMHLYQSGQFYVKAIRVYYSYHTCSNNELESQNGQAATCTADGWNNYYKCPVAACGKIYAAKDVTGTAYNNLDDWKASEEGKIEKLGHSLSTSWTSDGTDHWHVCTRENCTATDTKVAHSVGESGTPATCLQKAVCGTCGASFGSLVNHNLVLKNGQQATCNADGWKDYYQCTIDKCGKIFATNDPNGTSYTLGEWQAGHGKLDATPHTWTYEVSNNKITATCTNNNTHVNYIEVKADDATYSGEAYTKASVTDWSKSSYNFSKPEIEYYQGTTKLDSAPVNVGNYIAKISVTSGTNTYTAEKVFTISPLEVQLDWGQNTFTYDGTAQAPTASVANKANASDEVNVTVTGEQTDASDTAYTATASGLTGAAASNYVLPTNKTHSFTIGKLSVKQLDISIVSYDDVTSSASLGTDTPTYNGHEIKPIISVKLGGTALTQDSDYTLSGDLTKTASGLYSITVTGQGNFSDTKTINWEIKGKPFEDNEVSITPYDGVYDGKPHKIGVEVLREGAVVKYSTDSSDTRTYDEINPTFTNAGSYTVYFKVEESNSVTKYDSTTVIIAPRVVQLEWSNRSLTYNATSQHPTATITNRANGDGENDVYVDTYSGAKTNAGSYTAAAATLEGTKADNYAISTYPADKETTYTIAKAKVTVPTADPTEFVYNGTSQTYSLTADASKYTISGATQTNAGEYQVTVALIDDVKNNYEWDKEGSAAEKVADLTYDFIIKPLDISKTANISIIGDTYFEFDGNEHSVNISGITHSTKTGSLVKGDDADGKDYTIHGNKGLTIDKYTLTIKFNNNYTGMVEIPWDIVESIHSSTPVELDPEKVTNPDDKVVITIVGDEDLHHVKLEEPVDLLDENDYKLLNIGNSKYPSTKVLIEIVLSLDMNDEESINPDSLAAIKEISNDHAGHHFYDLTLRKVIKYVKTDGTDTVVHMDVVPIIESPNLVTITLDIPDTIDSLRSGYSRKYSIIRSHKNTEGIYKAEMMDSSVNDNKVSFTTNKFSDYALTYKDTLIPRSYKAPDTSVR